MTKKTRIYSGEKTACSISGAGKTGQPHGKEKLEHSLTPYTKRNLKWIKDLNIPPDTIKLLKENIGQTLSNINDSNIFSDPPLREMSVKTKINKWDLIKLKSFCTAKETLNKTKRQPTEWEKIFANELTDKGLIFKIYESFCSSIPKKKSYIFYIL